MNPLIARRAFTVFVAVLMLLLAWVPAMDTPAMEQVDAGMKRAVVTFAGARALNAAISLFQGTEITVGVGVQATLSVGEILDPVNDLVESFSNLMLLASVAFGIQKVLLTIGQYEYVKYALTLVVLAWAAARLVRGSGPRWLDVALLLMLMVRFAVPVMTIGSDAVYARFLEQDYTASQGALATMTEDLKTDADPGALSALDPRPTINRMKQLAANATDQVIELIVVFLLQTVLVPVFLVWALYVALRGALTAGQAN